MKRNELKTYILWVLENYPKSRDSDVALMLILWQRYFPKRIHKAETDERKFVYLKDIMDLPREDDIKRIRAIIQNEEKKFLPTSWEVAKQRRIKEEEWKEYVTNITP